jgi:hypothetical protein
MKGEDMSKADRTFELVRIELERAQTYFDDFHTYHQGFSVLKEEVDELWKKIMDKNPDRDEVRREAIHVAAMAIRFIVDLDTAANPRGLRLMKKIGGE